ncbi:hypothetical protein BJX96DRAFT_148197 [Aspergillus floccosus]
MSGGEYHEVFVLWRLRIKVELSAHGFSVQSYTVRGQFTDSTTLTSPGLMECPETKVVRGREKVNESTRA